MCRSEQSNRCVILSEAKDLKNRKGYMKPDILYEDEYMLAAVKPYGMPAQPDPSNREDLLTSLKNLIYDRGECVGEPYLAVINRLDRPVAGIVLFAKTEEAAAKLSDLTQERKIEKCYQAVVRGEIPDDEGELSDWLLFDKKDNISRVVPAGTKGAKKAELSYEVLDVIDTDEGTFTYLLIRLHTGRHHQIRCQLAHAGYPIWGDVKYGIKDEGKTGRNKPAGKSRRDGRGGGKEKVPQIGLYSSRMKFLHPFTGEEVFLHREPEGTAFQLLDAEDPDW